MGKKWTPEQKAAAKARIAAKKQTDALAKKGDTSDFMTSPVQQEIATQDKFNVQEAEKAIEEISLLERTQDFPRGNPIERWGQHAKLTIATPGHIVDDPTYIPEIVDLSDGSRRRIANHRIIDGQLVVLTADSQRKYRWCRCNDNTRLSTHKRRGFRFSSYKDLFAGTGLFEDWGPMHQVRNGDLVLMEISMDGWERMRLEKKRLQAALEATYGDELFSAGQSSGVPTFKEDFNRGVREYMTIWLGVIGWSLLSTFIG